MRLRGEFLKERADKKNLTLEAASSTDKSPFSSSAAFLLILTVRTFSALYSNISDCDETFNYWEPLHKLLHGHGLQTWEYSPEHCIRSYAYLATMALPLWLIKTLVTEDKVLQFYLLRTMLAVISSILETFFYRSVSKTHKVITTHQLLIFLLFSPAFFISTTAFLPSSFSMYACMCAYSWWWSYHSVFVPVLLVGCASLYGWPFAAIIGIPLALDMVLQHRQLINFTFSTIASLLLLLTPLCLIDTYYYGKVTIPPLNILLYNVFTQHGPDLYGTEPWWFYFINCFLNFNIAFIFTLLSFPLFVFVVLPHTKLNQILAHPSFSPLLVVLLWMLVFFTRPHKEERFIFPIYPFMVLSAAWAFEESMKIVKIISSKLFHLPSLPSLSSLLISLTFITISLSRILALYHGYHGSLQAYGSFAGVVGGTQPPHTPPLHVCIGKEWYRFPSHFFLPDGHHLKFLKSEFKGQLPGEFSTAWNATRLLPPHFNHLNIEQPQRYVDVESCDYLVDLSTLHHTPLEPPYSLDEDTWRVVVDEAFLDASRSHSLFRAFYIPFLSDKYTHYAHYHILARKDTRGS